MAVKLKVTKDFFDKEHDRKLRKAKEAFEATEKRAAALLKTGFVTKVTEPVKKKAETEK